MAKDADDLGRLEIEPGQFITTSKCKYLITEKLGEGGYGAVFKVRHEPSDGEEFAMKVEEKLEKRKHSKLSMEMHLLKLMSSQPTGKSHFGKIVDRSKKERYFMIIMTLVGENLNDLKKQRTPPVFSLGTGFGVGIQCLEAVEELHKVGYIHRDIKPANFAIGRFPRTHLVYILDFGIARKYTNEENVFKAPRRKVPFKGTVRFASLDCHRGKELGPKDDCESWIYMLVDFCNRQGLPWDREKDRHMVAERKKEARSPVGKERLFLPMCTKAMSSIMDYVDGLFYQDKVDYQFLYRMIAKAGSKTGANLGAPFDWEGSQTPEEEVTARKEKMNREQETKEREKEKVRRSFRSPVGNHRFQMSPMPSLPLPSPSPMAAVSPASNRSGHSPVANRMTPSPRRTRRFQTSPMSSSPLPSPSPIAGLSPAINKMAPSPKEILFK